MKIGPIFDGRIPPSLTDRQPRQATTEMGLKGGDSVEISDESRKQLAGSADEKLRIEQSSSPVYSRKDFAKDPTKNTGSYQTAERKNILAEIKDRIASGYYNRHDITFMVADKISDEFIS